MIRRRTWALVALVGVAVAGCGTARQDPDPVPRSDAATSVPDNSVPDSSAPASSGLPTSAPETAQESGHSATFVGPVRRVYTYDRGITLRPPSRSVIGASADWRSAFHACFEPAGCVATGAATVSIADVTGPSGFPSASGNLFDAVPAYVVIWQPTTSCLTVSAASCRQVDVIPVSTGKVVYAFQVDAAVPTPATL